jgi:ABC-type bacteriocin/lantibiotic exporter with double-glycine peptidase domain
MSTFVRTRHVPQAEESDCGVACLAIVLAHFGKHLPWHELHTLCGGGRDGLSAATLVKVGARLGLKGAGKKVRLEGNDKADLAAVSQLPVPSIVFVRGSHFSVLEGVTRRGKIALNDPASGRSSMPIAEFRAMFSGIALTYQPEPDFRPGGKPESMLQTGRLWLGRQLRLIIIAVLAGVLATAISVTGALLLRGVVSKMMTTNETPDQWLYLGLIAVAAGVVVATWVQQRFLSRTLLRLAVDRSVSLIKTMLTLPGSFFHRRFIGGIAARAQLADTVAMQLTGVFVPGIANAVAAAALLGVLLYLAWLPALVALAGTVVSTLIVRRAVADETARQTQLVAEQSRRDGETLNGLSMIENLKAEGSTTRLFDSWAESQARGLEISHRSATANLRHLGFATLAEQLAGVAVLVTGAVQVAAGTLGLADLIAAATLVGVFQASAGALSRSGLDLGRLRGSFLMLGDIAEARPEPAYRVEARYDRDATRLTGAVELRGVSFGYDVNREPQVHAVDLGFAPGQRVAVIGASGSGKSTLVKLLIGAAEPWTGRITVDGLPLAEIPRPVLLRSVGYVSQKPVLFEGSVTENLTFGDPGVNRHMITRALRDACIEQVVERRGGPDRAWVQQDGQNFSGGERQRLALARALCRNPSLLVLDEATSALEGPLEAEVDTNLRYRGISTVVVAHRLNTLRHGDLVLLMHEGRIVRLGTHEELLDSFEPYRVMVGSAR